MRPPRQLVIAALAVTVPCAVAVALLLGTAGCGVDTAAPTSTYLNRSTPGVYITSMSAFATDLLDRSQEHCG